MCFDSDSLPPIAVISGGAVTHEDLVLEADDGARFAAFAAQPDEPSQVGVVVLPDVRGLYRFYERPQPDAATRMEAPILDLQAGADKNTSAEDNAAFDSALTEAGVEHELVTYEGAPHSFFDRKQEDFAEASTDAWRRALNFIDLHRS